MERIHRLIAYGGGPVEKTKCNEVHLVEWDDGKGYCGSAWVQTKGQLEQVVSLLREVRGMKIRVEGHLVPRDKTLLIQWLNQHQQRLPKPISVSEHHNLEGD